MRETDNHMPGGEADACEERSQVVIVNPFADAITESIAKMLDGDAIQKMVDARMKAMLDGAMESAMRWGDAKKAMTRKIDEMLIPAIEGYDLAKCNIKLEELLNELVEESAIAERRDMLRRFGILMSTNDAPEVIHASDIAAEWEQWVSREFDCDGRDVEDGEYQWIEAEQSVRYRSSYSHLFEYADLTFKVVDKQNSSGDDFDISIRLSRWHGDEEWRIDNPRKEHLDVSRLRYLSDFATYLYRLGLAGTLVALDICDDTMIIQPDSHPGE